MDIKTKIVGALRLLKPEYIRLEDDDGISGFVVSHEFEGMSGLERQARIDEALCKAPLPPEERRRVLMIAGLTPEEYESVGARIRVHRIREKAGGVEVLLHGGLSEAEYVRGVLNRKGAQTTKPKTVEGAPGLLMSFRARGTEANPLTMEKTIRVLSEDRYVEVMPNPSLEPVPRNGVR